MFSIGVAILTKKNKRERICEPESRKYAVEAGRIPEDDLWD